MSTSEAETEGIRVRVISRYSPDHSQPSTQRWLFLYTIEIKNRSDAPVQLLERHWVITDAHGETEEVRGPGVIGKQPRLAPGEAFEYTSGCPLTTPFGSMHGSYLMERADGTRFNAEIAGFALRQPGTMQ